MVPRCAGCVCAPFPVRVASVTLAEGDALSAPSERGARIRGSLLRVAGQRRSVCPFRIKGLGCLYECHFVLKEIGDKMKPRTERTEWGRCIFSIRHTNLLALICLIINLIGTGQSGPVYAHDG